MKCSKILSRLSIVAAIRKHSKKLHTILSASILLFLVNLSMGCKQPAAAAAAPPVVKILEVQATNASRGAEIIGQLDSPENVQIRARVEGFVEKIVFTEGTNVTAGSTLFILDQKPFLERLAAAKGALGEAKAALNKYEKDVARLKPLAEKRAIPQQDLDNAQASVEVGKASVITAEARVQAAELDLSYCTITAPIDGLIGAKQVSVGELVGRGEPTLLTTISRLDPIWFYGAISEVQYLKAENEVRDKGRKVAELGVTLILADASVHPEKGHFVFFDRAVDAKTGTLRVRAQFANAKGRLRPGMFGRIAVDLGARPDSILVPERAVAELQGKNFVWLVSSDNKATQRPVQIGDAVDGYVQVMSGLKVGDRIVVEGLQKVKEGGSVQEAEAPQAKLAQASTAATPHSKK
ncbi:MAG TPA: efflux RND transporter periplasmic adaptor subunit [Verrucomicrobiae bacterium]